MQQTDDYEKTNLEMLAILNSVEQLDKAIKAGFSVNSRGKGGYTLLHYANLWNRPDVIRYLYRNHAELFPINKSNETPHTLSVKYENREANEMMLWAGICVLTPKKDHLFTCQNADKTFTPCWNKREQL
ncbi:hypothetical protein FGIG_01428 [Fasciola gigantica]|uniref:Uncharacterized protein n=1 Tax=Fasciola gigantica TaxID=46835 RepID=A0A504YR26_FASGI|nr:hypothetical protein FGIG_01428 [Fasciola gigantica]